MTDTAYSRLKGELGEALAAMGVNVSGAKALLREHIREVRAHPDLLERAELLLLAYSHPAYDPDDLEVAVDDLRAARGVFEQHGRSQEVAQTMIVTQAVLVSLGAMRCAIAMGKEALLAFPLTVQQRGDIAHHTVQALADLREFDRAQEWAKKHVEPMLAGERRTPERARWAFGLWKLSFRLYARSVRMEVDWCLDIDPTSPASGEEASRLLQAMKEAWHRASSLATSAADSTRVAIAEIAVAAADRDLRRAQTCFDRVETGASNLGSYARSVQHGHLGLAFALSAQWEPAYKHYRRAIAHARRSRAFGPLLTLKYVAWVAARNLGRHRESAALLEDFVRMQAATRRTSERWFTDAIDIELFGSRPPTGLYAPVGRSAVQPPYLRRALAVAGSTLSELGGVQDLAYQAGVGRRALELAMKRYVGVSPLAYLKELRLTRAYELLRSTALTMDEVANAVGYASAKTFRRDFVRRFNMTPAQLRDSTQE